MKSTRWKVVVLSTALAVVSVIPTSAQAPQASAAVTVPASGTFARGGEFTGTITINRFEYRDNQIVAIGMVTGTLSRGGRTLGSAVVGQVTWPVAVKAGGQVLAGGRIRESGAVTPISSSRDTGSAFRMFTVQAEACQVVDVALGAINVDVLGAVLALSPVTLNLSGLTSGPLGALVCEASELLNNVVALVGVLNSILGLLTGLLGGLTGGLGGGLPIP
jgi:hypothetical protein